MRNLNAFVGSDGKTLYSSQIVDRLTSGCPTIPIYSHSDLSLDFAHVGDITYLLNVTDDCSLHINNGQKGQLQFLTVITHINSHNTMFYLPQNILWDKNKAPFVSSVIGFYSIIEFMSDGYSNIYGRELQNGNRF